MAVGFWFGFGLWGMVDGGWGMGGWWMGWVLVGVSDMKNAQKILGVGPGKINEKNI